MAVAVGLPFLKSEKSYGVAEQLRGTLTRSGAYSTRGFSFVQDASLYPESGRISRETESGTGLRIN